MSFVRNRDSLATIVPALGEVVDKESLNFRFKTELCKYKTISELSLKPQSSQTPVTCCVDSVYRFVVSKYLLAKLEIR